MIWHPMSIQTGVLPREIISAKGDILITKDGQEIIDAISSWWTCIHGHRNPEIMDAIRSQTKELDHVIFAGFTHPPAEELASLIHDSTNHDFEKIFFSDNGSNAVEIGVKIALQFYKNRNRVGSSPDKNRRKFIRFSLSYHGDSIGAMSLGGESVFTRIFRDLSFPTEEFQTPNCVRCPFGKKPESCKTECLDEFRTYLESSADEVVGVVLEPLISGANGMIFHSKKFLQELRRLTSEHGILLILDEVFTGLFRTGEWYAYQYAEIKPDIICLAKGLTGGTLPLAVTLVTKEIFNEFDSPDPNKAFFHGHTMAGNPIACSAAVASLKILKREGIHLIKTLNASLVDMLSRLSINLGSRIRDPRVLGSVLAFEVEQDMGPDEYLNPLGRTIRENCLAQGVLIRPLGNTVYLTPSYHISEENLAKIFQVLEQVIEKEFTEIKS
jgi:adenosylmethionine-8-amino-7-oxononanoate aminotransferase